MAPWERAHVGGMTLPCRGCATDKQLRVSRPAHCHRREGVPLADGLRARAEVRRPDTIMAFLVPGRDPPAGRAPPSLRRHNEHVHLTVLDGLAGDREAAIRVWRAANIAWISSRVRRCSCSIRL